MTRLLLLLALVLAGCSRSDGAAGAAATTPGLERAVSDVEAARADAASPAPLAPVPAEAPR